MKNLKRVIARYTVLLNQAGIDIPDMGNSTPFQFSATLKTLWNNRHV